MQQRVPRRAWHAPGRPGRRPRVLVEDGNPVLAISDFSAFQDAGFDVAWCSGPGPVTGPGGVACPLLRGRDCEVLAAADVVLHGLDDGLAIAAAARRRHPGVPVVVRRQRRAGGSTGELPGGCRPLLATCSVRGQVEALRQALADPQRPSLRTLPTPGTGRPSSR